jgi:glycosyltransferase involved in cell wall biosynthesis
MSGPYRVLLVSDAYPPMIGGADRSVHALATGLSARGHTVTVATAWQPGLAASETQDGVEVRRLRDSTSRVPAISQDPYRHVPPPFPEPEAVARFARLVRRFRPDVVHSYGWITYSCAAALARRRVPLVLSLRDYGHFCPRRTLLHMGTELCSGPAPLKCLRCSARHYGGAKAAVAVAGVLGGRRLLTHAAAGVHSNSRYMQERAWRHLLGGRARFARGSSVDVVVPPFRRGAGEEVADPADLERVPEGCILFVGALRPFKGVPELLEAYGRLESPPPLVLVGTPEPDMPQEFPPGVTVIESLPHAAVMAAWDRALFGVFPSRGPEPYGGVVAEAMSRGRAAIGTTPGGHSELIEDGENGLLVPGGDVPSLAAAMRRLIDDRELRERLGANARRRMEVETPDHWLARVEELYEAVLR